MSTNSDALNRVLAGVRALNEQERRHVLQVLQQMPGGSLSAAQYHRHSEDWLLPGLEGELKKRGVLLTPLNPAKIIQWAPNYAREAAAIRKALREKLGERPPTQAELLSLGRACASALYDYASKRMPSDKSFGPRALLQAVADIPVALNAAFPGYIAGGLLRTIIR